MSGKAPLDYQLNTSFGRKRASFSKVLIDPILVFALLSILVFGLFVLFSASGQVTPMVFRQSIYIIIGLLLMFLISRLDQSIYKSFLMHLFWIGLILLIWVLLFPAEGYNTDRWIDLGFISFQPSEVLRLLLPLAVASYLTRNQRRPSVKDWCIVLIAILVSSFLIYKQPDLGTQSQLDFIPESHSDFIFSVIGEEFGFLGITLIFLVYGIILYRVFKIAFNSSTEFSRLTISSIGFIFLIYILINVSMTVGTLPVVGVPLPLISQGGTSILIHLVAFGFVLSMKKRETW